MRKAAILAVFIFLTLLPAPVQARTNLIYSLYQIELLSLEDTNVLVTETIKYLNLDQTISLSIQKRIPARMVENIQVVDETGPLSFSSRSLDNFTEITFSTRWIETGREYTIRISYVLTKWAKVAGGSYIVSFWGLKEFDFDCQQFLIKVYGPPGYVPFLCDLSATSFRSPPSFLYSTTISRGRSFAGLTAIFSKRTFYSISLDYEINADVRNLSLDVILVNPYVEWQFSSLVSADPMPSEVFFDKDGNLHGVFKFVNPEEVFRLRIQLFFDVSVYDPEITSENVEGIFEIPPELAEFLLPTEWWPCDNPTILSIVEQMTQMESNSFLLASAIMKFVEDRLSYQQQEVRRGVFWSLESGIGDCSEYTDLFITLARASGLSARALYGWAYTTENFSPHAFAEIYLPMVGWQPVDPSWGDSHGDYFCRLDSSHIVRSRRGVNDSESWINVKYVGKSVQISEKVSEVKILSPAEAAQLYVQSARTHLEIARNLARENRELLAKISEAELELALAEIALNFDATVHHAKRSVELSNEVIRAWKPETQFRPLWILLVVGSFLFGVLCSIVSFKSRKRKGRRYRTSCL
ncbi:MAG: transglutaminase domain-containing protein [Candidatus Hadarchaeales archaeon]